jgi:hypothetical protein|tara:strand:- start:3275 stop:3784 length:510 start_codon:yes stop_codon:yes gene_type:complete
MALNIQTTADCDKIIITASGGSDPNSINTIEVETMDGFNDFEYQFTATATNTRIVTSADLGGANGVITVKHFIDGTLHTTAGALFACDVLCCIAHKIDELLDCDCDCNKCSEHFVEAQKIFLILKAAETQLATADTAGDNTSAEAIIQNAIEKYETAQAMCAGHCGCNC